MPEAATRITQTQDGRPFVPSRGTTLDVFASDLLDAYGPQGWWPLLSHAGSNPTLTGRLTGYHPGDYSLPSTDAERFEICCGAILTQNTAWTNVERALGRLNQQALLSPEAILSAADAALEAAVHASGYFRAKAKKLRVFSEFYLRQDGRTPTRDELLGVWGIGSETADSMRLYAYKETEMMVDAYTLRVLCRHRYCRPPIDYERAKRLCERQLPRSLASYQEFHALMVEHAKRLRATDATS